MSRVSNKPYFVYVLWSDSGHRFYIGISENPAGRLAQHNAAQNSGWTSRYQPWQLVFSESHPDYTSARRRENELKMQKGGRGFFMKTGIDAARFERGS